MLATLTPSLEADVEDFVFCRVLLFLDYEFIEILWDKVLLLPFEAALPPFKKVLAYDVSYLLTYGCVTETIISGALTRLGIVLRL